MKQIIERIKQETRALIAKKNYKNLTEKLKINATIINLLATNKTMKCREIYYQSPNIFKKQSRVSHFLHQLSSRLNVDLKDFNIMPSTKGVFIGKVVFYCRDGKSRTMFSGLIPDMTNVTEIEVFHAKVLVVEKDCLLAFIQQSVRTECLLVSGKGYPCKNTITFLEMLQHTLLKNKIETIASECKNDHNEGKCKNDHNEDKREISQDKYKCKIFGLFDLDPSGLHIFKVYKYGSIKSPHFIQIQRIGLTSKDIYKYKIEEFELIELTRRDVVLLDTLIKYDVDDEFKEDVMFLKGLGKKMEIEIIINNTRKLTKEYFKEKLK